MSFDNHTFDLVTAMFMLHEVPEDVRWQIVDECARVVKMDGRLLFVEFHGGPYSFPKGWLIKAYILFGEMLAGHFEHYRQHIAGGGLPGLLDDLSMQVYGESVSENGNTAMVLLGIAS
jgi:ubiquinone/menaquinone biosynthesis C-methylase UbiE